MKFMFLFSFPPHLQFVMSDRSVSLSYRYKIDMRTNQAMKNIIGLHS